MTARQQPLYSLKGTSKIPGHERYFIDRFGNVFMEMTGPMSQRVHKMKCYKENFTHREYVMLSCLDPKSGKQKSVLKYIEELLLITFKRSPKKKPQIIIHYVSGSGRKPLKRMQVINHLVRFHKDVQIPLTPNKDGLYETSEGMKGLGISVCPECGHPQPVEFIKCGECNEWLTLPALQPRGQQP